MSPMRRGFFWGASLPGQAFRLLRSHRELWVWCALPFTVNLATFALAILFFLGQWDSLDAFFRQLLATGDPTAWYEWLWVGPLRVLTWLVKWIVLALFAVAVWILFTVIGGVIASPFLEVLSRRVEAIQTGGVQEEQASGIGASLRAALRVFVEEGKRTLFFIGGQLGFFLLGWVPGLQPVAAAGSLGFTVIFLPLDYTGYILDRRQIPFRTRRRWVWAHRRAMVGFGGAALGSFFVPGVNFLCLPLLVTAATILALEVGMPDEPD
jgi:CysZ protein